MPKLSPQIAKIRAKKLVKDLQDAGGNMAVVAFKQGRTRQAVSQQLKKNYVQKTFQEMMDKGGITDTRLIKKASALLDAKKSVPYDSEEGGLSEVADNQIQHKALETCLKMKGHLSQEPKEGSKSITWVQILNGIEIKETQKLSFAELITTLESKLKNQIP